MSAFPSALVKRLFERSGYHLLRKNYNLPIPEAEDMTEDYFHQSSKMVGVRIDDLLFQDLLKNTFPPYLNEFRQTFPLHKDPSGKGSEFFLINGSYMAIDAHVYYSMIRHHRPMNIIEIGGGNSSLLAAAALRINSDSGGHLGRLTVIEPYPSEQLKLGFPGLKELIVSKIQDVDLTVFTALGAGDILFIDSSHVLRSGGDVLYEYLEILPRLAPGVLIHIHDISLPKHYPRVYFENGLYWNEQYLLQAFLSFNSKFEIIWPGNYVMVNYPDIMRSAFPEFEIMRQQFPSSEPTAFWMRVLR